MSLNLENHFKNPWYIKLRLTFTSAYATQDMGDYVIKYKKLRKWTGYFKGRHVVYLERCKK